MHIWYFRAGVQTPNTHPDAPLVGKIGSLWNWPLRYIKIYVYMYIWTLLDRVSNPQNPPHICVLGWKIESLEMSWKTRNFLKLPSKVRAYIHLGTFWNGCAPPKTHPIDVPLGGKIGSFWNWPLRWGHMYIWALSGRGSNPQNPPPRCAPVIRVL